MLHTDNPAAPHSMSVRMSHGECDSLLFDFGGPRALFVREV
jgi:hypothetical protein